MDVQRVVASVGYAADEPSREEFTRLVQHAIPFPIPMNLLGRLTPETFRIGERSRVRFVVAGCHAAYAMPAPRPAQHGYNRSMKSFVTVLACAVAVSAHGQSSSFQLHGFLTGREIRAQSQPSWTTGGFGRFDVGANSADDRRTLNVDIAQLGLDWTPMTWLTFHADGLARKEQSGTIGRRAGIVQAYVDFFTQKFRLRAGSFWLPTSR